MPQFIFFLNFYLKIYIQSTLVISNSTGLSKLLRDIFSSTYQICRIEDKINRTTIRGWSGVAKVSCILRHRGVQLILANSLARPAILVAGKGRGGECFISSVPVPLSSLSLSFISSTISSISFLPFSGRRHKMTHKG